MNLDTRPYCLGLICFENPIRQLYLKPKTININDFFSRPIFNIMNIIDSHSNHTETQSADIFVPTILDILPAAQGYLGLQ